MAIFLVRHGETASNAARVVQTPETPLSERGMAQAERLAIRLASASVGRILSSDLPRARMTAECVQSATGAPLDFDAGLQERNFGDVRGTPYAELGADLFAADYVPPGGESWDALHRRVDVTWERVVAAAGSSPGNLVVVTHGLVCYSLLARVVALPLEDEATLRVANTALTVIDDTPPWPVRLLNCTAHLDVDPVGWGSREAALV